MPASTPPPPPRRSGRARPRYVDAAIAASSLVALVVVIWLIYLALT